MTLEELLRELGPLPTMMTARQELEIMRRLEAIPDELLHSDWDRFAQLLLDLYDSHTGDAIFEVNSSNLGEFQAFASRLARLSEEVRSQEQRLFLQGIASVFSQPFSMP